MRNAIPFGLWAFVLSVASAIPLGWHSTPVEREVTALTQRLAIVRALDVLALTPAQQMTLLPLITAQVDAQNAIRDAQVKAQPDMEQAMLGLRAALLDNNGVPDRVKRAVSVAEVPYYGAARKLGTAQLDRAASVWALLTTAQGARLRRGFTTDAQWLTATASQVSVPRKDVPRGLRWIYTQYGLRGEELDSAVEFGKPIVIRWRQQPEPLTTEQTREFVQQLIALPDKGILTPEPDQDAQRSILYHLLTQKTLHYLTGKTPLPPIDDAETLAVKTATDDVRVLNLANSLYLTPEQMKGLIDITRRAKVEYDAVQTQRADWFRRVLPIVQAQLELAERKQAPDPALGERYAACRQELTTLAAAPEKLDRGYLPEVKTLLTANQLDMVGNFVPCIIPVQSLTNPERIGQVIDRGGMERTLGAIRTLPEEKVPAAVTSLQRTVAEDFRRHHYSDGNVQQAVAQVPRVVAEARALDDAEFALQKCTLADRISVPAIAPVTGRAIDDRLVYYLLSPNLIPVLEARTAIADTVCAPCASSVEE